jgi:hypothetical protein
LNTIGLVIFGLSALITAVVGIRLLFVASRSREIPELAVGLVMIMELISAASWAAASATAAGQLISTVAAAGSVACMALFIVYTFAPGSRLARAGAAALLLAAGACVLLPTLSGAWGSGDFYLRFGWVASLARAIAYGWAAVAAGRSRAALQRRARLGLSHPLTASRVGFWCLGAGFACISYSMPLLEIVTDTVRPLGISPISVVLAIGASTFIWLAFYPPRVYLTWALRRAGRA